MNTSNIALYRLLTAIIGISAVLLTPALIFYRQPLVKELVVPAYGLDLAWLLIALYVVDWLPKRHSLGAALVAAVCVAFFCLLRSLALWHVEPLVRNLLLGFGAAGTVMSVFLVKSL